MRAMKELGTLKQQNSGMQEEALHHSASSFIPHPSSLILSLVVLIVLLYGVVYPNLHVLTASLQSNGVP